MRVSRAQSRGVSRAKSPAPSLLTKSMKLPLIANGSFGADETVGSTSVWPTQQQKSSGYSVGVCSQQGKRPYQEDEYSLRPFLNVSKQGLDLPETHFFGLFDGHAGGKCSQHVAANLANTLLEDESFVTNLPQAIKRSFYTVNEQFLKIAEKLKLHDGSTGICAIIRDNKILVANAGDCRCLLISNGRPIQLSNDHKPTSPDEQKRINALGGQVVYCMGVARVNRVLAVSRAFGNRTLRTVIRPDAELMQREVADGDDFLVIASDGLWDVLKNKDVCDVCYSPFLQRKSQAISDELVQLALNKGSMDNVTCIVVNLSDYRNKSLVLKDDPFTLQSNKPSPMIVSQEGKDITELSNMSGLNKSNRISGIENNNMNNSVLLNDDEEDDNITQVDISSAISAQHQAFRKHNITNGSNMMMKVNNNNMTTHELPSRQMSMGNFLAHENDVGEAPGNSMASPALSSNASNRKQVIGVTRAPLVKATSTSSINTVIEVGPPSFPTVTNNPNATANTVSTDNNRLFTSTDPFRINFVSQKPMSRGVAGNEIIAQHKANFPSNMRGRNPGATNNVESTQQPTNKGLLTLVQGREKSSEPSKSRTSLGDLTSYINDFNATAKSSFL